MKVNWCKILGHNWCSVYVGETGKWKVILCFCKRCLLGHSDVIDFVSKHQLVDYNTFNEKYFK